MFLTLRLKSFLFSYISRNETRHILSPSSKNKKNPARENFLHFLAIKPFLYFEKRKPREKSLYFRKWKFYYISRNGKPRKLLKFQDVTFFARNVKRNHS